MFRQKEKVALHAPRHDFLGPWSLKVSLDSPRGSDISFEMKLHVED